MTQHALRRLAISATAVLVALLVTLAILARVHATAGTPAAEVPAPLATGTELPKPKLVPTMHLIDSQGKPFTLNQWHGKWVVLAPSMTLCREVCPMTTGALMQLKSLVDEAGLSRQVIVAEATVDPWRDSPARLRAYERLTGADFQMLTGTQAEIRALWKFFGVYYERVPEDNPPDIDWWTHKPEKFDIDHTDALFILDPAGQQRIAEEGMPEVSNLSKPLRQLLDSEGVQNLMHPQLPWTASEALDDVYNLMDRNVPARSVPKVTAPSAARAQRDLAGSPHGLAAIHAQAGQLLGSQSELMARIKALRGYPIVVNAWASWCPPCRAEFGLFGAASARFGTKVAFLGVDVEDSASDASAFLAKHPVSYPSYQASSSDLSPIASLQGTPSTIYISASGKVLDVHTGQYDTESTLVNDIERYAFGVSG